MERKPVASSNLRDVGFDKPSRTLEVGFRSGSVYQYTGVHPNTARYLLSAPSKGKFFHKNIRSRFPFQKL